MAEDREQAWMAWDERAPKRRIVVCALGIAGAMRAAADALECPILDVGCELLGDFVTVIGPIKEKRMGIAETIAENWYYWRSPFTGTVRKVDGTGEEGECVIHRDARGAFIGVAVDMDRFVAWSSVADLRRGGAASSGAAGAPIAPRKRLMINGAPCSYVDGTPMYEGDVGAPGGPDAVKVGGPSKAVLSVPGCGPGAPFYSLAGSADCLECKRASDFFQSQAPWAPGWRLVAAEGHVHLGDAIAVERKIDYPTVEYAGAQRRHCRAEAARRRGAAAEWECRAQEWEHVEAAAARLRKPLPLAYEIPEK